MRALLLLVLVAMLSTSVPAGAQFYEVAPVQVEVRGEEGEQWSYDCYPSAQPAGPYRMTVYFNTQSGLAMYACDLVGRVPVRPMVPFVGINLAEWFGPVPEGGGA